MSAQRAPLSEGRWHFQHGPIDIVIGADGRPDALQVSHAAAWERFRTVLDELVGELAALRQPVGADPCTLRGAVARRMWSACRPYRADFITPMAAVAGAVAQELIGHYARPGVDRAWVNNGGDIALYLAPGRSVRVGLYADIARLDAAELRDGIRTDGWFDVRHESPVRGVATSGWRGRSFSLGIADSVTVLARSAAEADAAATVIANAVDVDDPRIVRRPARELKDDSDLGDLPVTVGVPCLDRETVRRALESGLRCAQALYERGLVWSCVLVCQGVIGRAGAHGGAAAGAPQSAGAAAHAH
ncbi:MAG: thiamine biosynthesis protein ApbE [Lautropia sp. SCN 69-89]|nr:MAG: thiamine biosynthesis protein ApbE [Lautropia sp. SCN 69-89]